MMQRGLSISLIVAAGALTYLCATMAGLLSIDDVGMISSITNESFTIRSLFFAGANEYYRPLVVVSYTLNAFWGGLEPFSFHAVNVALHIANSLLVYWLACELPAPNKEREWVALFASLFFLLSPINSEAVTWISARPDLLCTFFFLLALVLMVKRRESASPGALCCFAFAYLASLASKETSIALLGIAPLFLLLTARRGHRRDALLFVLTLFGTTCVYAFLRTGKQLMLDKGVGSVLKGVGVVGKGALGKAAAGTAAAGNAVVGSVAVEHPSLLDALGAYGFYLKKLVNPYPLSFTILGYDRFWAFASLLLALVGALWLLRRYQAALLPVLVVCLGIVPALLAYLGRIAFTPLGERYLYLPMVGFSLLVALVLADLKKVPRIVPLGCLLLLGILTMARVAIWCDGTAFWNDALKNAPGFAKSYSALGVIALQEQKYDEAERQMKKAIALGFDETVVWQNLGRVYLARKDYQSYEEAMVKAAARTPYPTGIYQELILALMNSQKGGERSELDAKVVKYHLLALSRDPSYLDAYYNVGKIYLAGGDLRNAKRYLGLYTERARNGYFRPFALKMLDKIAAGESS